MAGAKRSLKPRTQAQQQRSRESVGAILEACEGLLRKAGPTAVTTPAIAQAAGLSVGALYHFFPNKEAIVLALYETKLEAIRSFAATPIKVRNRQWRQALRDWISDVKQREAGISFDIAMNDAMRHFPALAASERRHATMLADLLVARIKELGAVWSDAALFDLAVHVFYLNQSLWLYWTFAGRPLEQGIERLAESAVALIAPAIEGPAPRGPFARR